jgi:hypothetical protein
MRNNYILVGMALAVILVTVLAVAAVLLEEDCTPVSWNDRQYTINCVAR